MTTARHERVLDSFAKCVNESFSIFIDMNQNPKNRWEARIGPEHFSVASTPYEYKVTIISDKHQAIVYFRKLYAAKIAIEVLRYGVRSNLDKDKAYLIRDHVACITDEHYDRIKWELLKLEDKFNQAIPQEIWDYFNDN